VYVGGVGTAKPVNSVLVRAQVSGKIAEIDFREGQDLQKGDPIARLDDALYKAQRDQALAKKAQDEAVLLNAERELQRDERLVQSGNMTEQLVGNQRALVAQNRAQVAADQAAVEAAEAQLSYTTITAPISGRTGLRTVDVGNLVSSGDATGIVTLSQIRPIAVIFSVPQQQLARVNAASREGPLRVDALSSEEGEVLAEGRLTVVDNQVDPTTGTVRLKAEFPNETLALWPGAFVNTRLLVETRRDVLTVPSAAVQRGPTGAYVYVVSADNHVQLRPVTVTLQDERTSVVDAGLSVGELVVTTGFARLQDGASVRVSSPEEADPAKLAVPIAEAGGGKHHKGKHGPKPPTAAAPAAGTAPPESGHAGPTASEAKTKADAPPARTSDLGAPVEASGPGQGDPAVQAAEAGERAAPESEAAPRAPEAALQRAPSSAPGQAPASEPGTGAPAR
ncbi:efflux RND transporter periplasmic adaptor subunit, partial [Aureimonas sp. AU40]|uniref:efflux RND transporter periplasmic adaptor subunit n=1 Tax=Aureimonas sp. AU40 TaxID=1637747 RepID=UPI000783A90B